MKHHAKFLLAALLFSAPAAWARDVAMEVTGTDGVRLAGTLTLPDTGPTRVPALLLIQGSGPVDRDGNAQGLPPIDLEKTIATALAADGIASLRLDKRGQNANAASLPSDRTAWAQFFRWDAYVGDLKEALRALTKRPEIDPAHVGVLGHSEGGLVALVLAADTKEPRPRALLLLATAGRSTDQLLHDQNDNALRKLGFGDDARAKKLAELDTAFATIRDTNKIPASVQDTIPPYLGTFLGPSIAQKPADLARAYPGPVLVLQGGSDLQVSPTRDTPPLTDAFQGRGSQSFTQFVLVPGASHNFKQVKGEDDYGFAGPVVPQTLQAIRDFVRTHL